MKNIVFLVFALSLILFQPAANAAQALMMRDTVTIVSTETSEEHEFLVELAVSPQQLRNGLMHRTKLDEDEGMLFWFGKEEDRFFWMKNTLISLDILFIKKDGTIHSIHENAIPMSMKSIASNGPVAAGLEIPAGTVQKLGIRPGDKIIQRFFSN